MATFKDNFIADRGDVIYGIDEDRQKYKVKATASWQLMDKYNNEILPSEKHFVSGKGAYLKVRDPNITEVAVEKLKGINHHPERAGAYLDTLAHLPKTPLDLANLAPKYAQKEPADREPRYSNMIRKACKGGIDFILREGGEAHLHFVLDTLSADDYHKVKVKMREYNYVAYTYSELRYLQKNWERLNRTGHGRIHFYIKEEEVEAPWVANPWVLTNTSNPDKAHVA